MKNIGKTFITKNNGRDELLVVSLQSHVHNVKALAEVWSRTFIPSPNHHEKLIEAARYHDEAKKLAWTVNPFNKHIEPPGYHAWRGCDFYRNANGEDYDVYIYWLIRLHHGFKTEYIAEAMADIKEHSTSNYRDFARDLYLLITCDWFDSEMLNYWANADQEANPREPHPFEEFMLHKKQGSNVFWIEPCPLEQSVMLSLEYARLPKTQFADTNEFKELLKGESWQVEHYEVKGQNDGVL